MTTPAPVVVFTGPTLSPARAAAVLGPDVPARVLGPVAQGDVYRVSLDAPLAIGVIDGTFERVPSVWHKEILWALSRGVHVLGSSSMGALRAAELAPFGMVGVGAIFEAFRDEALEDDDEVAVAHGPADDGYRATSEAMVNIRHTLRAARAARVIDGRVHDALIAIGKALFYPERTFATVLAHGHDRGLDPAQLDALAAWLPAGAIDQKRADAEALLAALRDLVARAPGPVQPTFHFHHTEVWEQVARRLGRDRLTAAPADVQPELVADELRLRGAAEYERARSAALVRALAAELARARGAAGPDLVASAIRALRLDHGLHAPEQLDAWLAERGLDEPAFDALMRRDAARRWAEAMFEADLPAHLRDELTVRGSHGALAARAARKQAALAAAGEQSPPLADSDLPRDALIAQHFSALGQPVPADLARHARALGLPDDHALVELLLRERRFRALTDPEP